MAGNQHQSSKTHCPRGHAYTSENTKLIPSTKPGHFKRQCRECKTLRAKGQIATVTPRKKKGPAVEGQAAQV